MVADFSPRAMEMMFAIPGSKTLAGNKVVTYRSCRKRFAELVGLLAGSSIPTSLQSHYTGWMSELEKYNA